MKDISTEVQSIEGQLRQLEEQSQTKLQRIAWIGADMQIHPHDQAELATETVRLNAELQEMSAIRAALRRDIELLQSGT